MDRASQSFFSLLGLCAVLGAWVACGFATYVLAPLLFGGALSSGLAAACLLPAIVLTVLLGVSIGAGLRTLLRLLAASRRLERRVVADTLPSPPTLHVAVQAAGLDGRVRMIEGEEPSSFVHGILTPRIAISRGFVEQLSDAELRATLEHERYHVCSLDPLRALLAKVMVDAFFLLPSLEGLRDRYELGRELAADRRAETVHGPRALVGALLKALQGPESDSVVSASLADRTHLDARISRLETGRAAVPALGRSSDLGLSILGGASFAMLFAAAVFGLGGGSALTGLASDEFSASGALFCLICLVSLGGGTLLAMHRLSLKAARPLLGEGSPR